MAMSFRIDEKQRCIFTTLSGVVEDWNLGTGVQALLEDPRFDKHFSRLVDATEISNVDALQSDFLQSVAQDLSSGNQRGQENADKCAWNFGATSQAPNNGSQYNLVFGGLRYLIQQNWVNASGGYCALSYP